MRALVVFGSMFGNARQIAEAVAACSPRKHLPWTVTQRG